MKMMRGSNLSLLIPEMSSKLDYFLFRLKSSAWKVKGNGFFVGKKKKKK